MAYIDHPQYKSYIDTSNNCLLRLCKHLALNGSSVMTYKQRLQIHQTIFKEVDSIADVKIIDGRCNVLFIITQLLRTEPSAIHKLICSNEKCQGSPKGKFSPIKI